MNEAIVKACIEVEQKYGHLPFDKALPMMQAAWWNIGGKYELSGQDVFKIYMDWKAKNL